MTPAEIIGLIGASSAIIVTFIKALQDRAARRDEAKGKKTTVSKSLDEFKVETSTQFKNMDSRIGTLEHKVQSVNNDVGLVIKFNRAQAYDKIRFLGLQAIKHGSIAADELQTLVSIYQTYQEMYSDNDKMKNDVFLDQVMNQVYSLRIKPTDICKPQD